MLLPSSRAGSSVSSTTFCIAVVLFSVLLSDYFTAALPPCFLLDCSYCPNLRFDDRCYNHCQFKCQPKYQKPFAGRPKVTTTTTTTTPPPTTTTTTPTTTTPTTTTTPAPTTTLPPWNPPLTTPKVTTTTEAPETTVEVTQPPTTPKVDLPLYNYKDKEPGWWRKGSTPIPRPPIYRLGWVRGGAGNDRWPGVLSAPIPGELWPSSAFETEDGEGGDGDGDGDGEGRDGNGDGAGGAGEGEEEEEEENNGPAWRTPNKGFGYIPEWATAKKGDGGSSSLGEAGEGGGEEGGKGDPVEGEEKPGDEGGDADDGGDVGDEGEDEDDDDDDDEGEEDLYGGGGDDDEEDEEEEEDPDKEEPPEEADGSEPQIRIGNGAAPPPPSPTQGPDTDPGSQPTEAPSQKRTPDEQFYDCCEDSSNGISSKCYSGSGGKTNLCNYDNINRGVITSTFLSKSCPDESLGKVLVCASSEYDHTSCCQARGVPSVCNMFCNPSGGLTAPGIQHLKCLDLLQSIVSCFKEYAEVYGSRARAALGRLARKRKGTRRTTNRKRTKKLTFKKWRKTIKKQRKQRRLRMLRNRRNRAARQRRNRAAKNRN